MTFFMAILVALFGILAALYLRDMPPMDQLLLQ